MRTSVFWFSFPHIDFSNIVTEFIKILVYWHDAIDGLHCLLIQFVMFGEFFDNEKEWVIYGCLIIRVDYVHEYCYSCFVYLFPEKNVPILGASGITGLLRHYKAVTSNVIKNQNVVAEKTSSRLDFNKSYLYSVFNWKVCAIILVSVINHY